MDETNITLQLKGFHDLRSSLCYIHIIAFSSSFSLYPTSPGFSFASWFGYAFPQMVILLFVAWIWIQIMFLKFRYVKLRRV